MNSITEGEATSILRQLKSASIQQEKQSSTLPPSSKAAIGTLPTEQQQNKLPISQPKSRGSLRSKKVKKDKRRVDEAPANIYYLFITKAISLTMKEQSDLLHRDAFKMAASKWRQSMNDAEIEVYSLTEDEKRTVFRILEDNSNYTNLSTFHSLFTTSLKAIKGSRT